MLRKNETPLITELPLTKKQERRIRRDKIVKRAKYVGVLAAAAVTAAVVARKEARKTIENVQFEYLVVSEETGELMGGIKSKPPKK